MSGNEFNLSEYREARKSGERAYRRATLSGRYPYLPDLDSMLGVGKVHDEIRLGISEIPLEMIAGTRTRDRAAAFAPNFMPLLEETSEFALKWSRLFAAHMNEGIRDPVKVYEYMRRFYVLEGNKRVSVLKYLGGATIAADVIRILPEKSEDEESLLYFEFLDFYRVCPVYDFDFSVPGSYRMFARLLGLDLEHPWKEEEISVIRAARASFEREYLAHGGGKNPGSVCDALLVYLQVYSLDSLLNESSSLIGRRIEGLHREFLTKAGEDNIRLVDHAEEPREKPVRLPFLLSGSGAPYTESSPLRAAFLYDRTPDNSSWIYRHELGRNYVEDCFGGLVKTFWYKDCGTDDVLAEAIQDAAEEEGCQVIFTVSPVMMKETLRSAIRFPGTKFLNCSINLKHNAVRTYYSRMYEAEFLMGAVAAISSESGVIGYRADYPIYGTFADINAFATGAAMINPQAKVILSWASEEGADWREDFRRAGADVISGPDSIKPEDASREYGIFKTAPDGSVVNLAAPVRNWGRYYEIILRSILDGSYDARSLTKDDQAVNYYLGMEDGVIDVLLSEKLPYYTRKTVALMRDGIVSGRFSPFDGEVRSRDRVVKKEESGRLSSGQIITMNWLNDNVIGTIPDSSSLKESARNAALVSGVIEGMPGADAAKREMSRMKKDAEAKENEA